MLRFFLLVITCLLVINCTNDNLQGAYVNEDLGIKLKLHQGKRYHIILTKENEIFKHSGIWNKKGNEVWFNSDIQPNTGNLVEYTEIYDNNIEKDSLIIEIETIHGQYPTGEGDSLLFFGPGQIVLNDEFNFSPNGRPFSKLYFPNELETVLIHGWLTDYPTYQLKNPRTNWLKVKLSATYSKEIELFPKGSYFTDEKMKLKGDTLYFGIIDLIKKGK